MHEQIKLCNFFSTVDYMPFTFIGGIVHVMFSVIFPCFNIPVVSSFIKK